MPLYKPLIVANWKMNMDAKKESDTFRVLASRLKKIHTDVHVVVCPSFLGFFGAQNILTSSSLYLTVGVQDCFWEEKGAYTGEISAQHVEHLGGTHAIIGHSERRMYLSETDEMVHKKLSCIYKNSHLTPILCVGETALERKAHKTNAVIARQLRYALSKLQIPEQRDLVIAYEPVWAIGTGVSATPDDCARACLFIRNAIRKFYPQKFLKSNVAVLYGGSVTSSNIKTFLYEGHADGALVGGASLDPHAFIELIKQC